MPTLVLNDCLMYCCLAYIKHFFYTIVLPDDGPVMYELVVFIILLYI